MGEDERILKKNKCPICGDEVQLFIFYNGDIVGCEHCGVHIPKQTNADCIRAMTDEELAVFIAEQAGCEWCIARVGDDCDQCPKAWLDWLKAEVTE